MKEIKIGQGLGNIKFGYTREELKKVLGEPDEIDKYSYTNSDTDLTESWHYDDSEISVSFDQEDDWLLGAISVSSDEFLFNGQKLIGKSEEEVLSYIMSIYPEDIEHEFTNYEDDPERILVSFEDLSLSLWFMNGILEEIEWGVLWDDADMQIWPE
ncbi:MAG: hypothetical protein JXR51_12850 [Bacteroidales bacterium]|nr:hypothetical protein [Bacteroidales bacterium]MBN2758059.1 hypothetical protein [Bacteroidales bacterium]